ncbi:hypothetical protein [uncultured Jatrophihabitans sp.]|uniref:hypothetical protein n=1 Tax=uncultured Jatrophihabitans sp. TaxID=1610747 RepID=UPI0035CB7BE9
MPTQNTAVRALHDVGVAAWFGGSLMGAVGLNGGANDIADPLDRSRVAAAGWARWAPVNAAAIGAHLIGGGALLLANRGRAATHTGVRANTVAKTALTGAALATTAYTGVLGARIAAAGRVPSAGGAKPSDATPATVASAQKQQRVFQWVLPALTGAIIVLGAQQGEQQRPGRRLAGAADALRHRTNTA